MNEYYFEGTYIDSDDPYIHKLNNVVQKNLLDDPDKR